MFDHIQTHLTEVSLAWDFKGDNNKADLDVSAVVFDEMGTCIDAVYYNQLAIFGGALTHSGDAQGDQGSEVVSMDLSHDAMMDAKVIAIVVTAHNKDGTFKDVESGRIRYAAVSKDDKTSKYDLESHELTVSRREATAMIAAFIYRDNDDFNVWHEECWNKHISGENLHTFQDCIPQITTILKEGDSYLPEWAAEEAVLDCGKVFNMTKSSVATISNTLNNLQVGLGWDANGVDLDSGVILMRGPDEKPKKVYFSHKSEKGVLHNGDNLTGEGEGDDETIDINLSEVDDAVDQMFVTMNVYTSGKSMKDVQNAYIRLLNKGGQNEELARYTFGNENSTSNDNGFIFARFYKAGQGKWKYQAVGEGVEGANSLSNSKMITFAKKEYQKALHSGPSGAGNNTSSSSTSRSFFG